MKWGIYNMKTRFKTTVAVFLILEREINGRRQILLQKRFNTGYMDGMWDCGASGHLEKGESMKNAIIREAKEELNIALNIDDVSFAAISHTFSDVEYIHVYFVAKRYEGAPEIAEKDKCSDLAWFDISDMPEDIIPNRKTALINYFSGVRYNEFYWK